MNVVFADAFYFVARLNRRDQHHDRVLKFYHQHADKKWTLTDCVSFVIMREQNVTDALTGDKHFEQAGFVALLK